MALHLQKLCVGADSIEDLQSWITERMAEKRRLGQPEEQTHTTRMAPKRVAELLDGGSLYWVIKGAIQVRQPLMDLRTVTGADGIQRCQLVLEPVLIRTEHHPRRPFQGWRYLEGKEVPRDVSAAAEAEGLPPHLVSALRELGLL